MKGLLISTKLLLWRAQLGSPTSGAALENMSVMEKAVQHRADRGRIAHQLSPVFDWAVGGQQSAGPLVASHDDLQQFFGGRQG